MIAVIILPTYNEAGNIESLIAVLEEEVFSKVPKNFSMKILVADDNSPDGTGEIVKKLQPKYNNLYLLSGHKRGLGAAYLKAMRYAIDQLGAEVLFEMDADFSHDPKDIIRFLKKINEGSEFVVGARYIKGGSIPQNWPFHRKLFSVVANIVVRFGLGVLSQHEWTNGYRVMKPDVFLRVADELRGYNGYVFQVAFIDKALDKGIRVDEIPIQFTDRRLGHSKIASAEYIFNVFKYVGQSRVNKLMRGPFLKFAFVGFFGFVLQTIIARALISVQVQPSTSVVVGAESAIISNFFFNNFWTFAHKKHTAWQVMFQKLVHFNGVSLGAILIQYVVVAIGTYLFGADAWFVSMVFAILFLVIPYSYFIYNKLIWKTT